MIHAGPQIQNNLIDQINARSGQGQHRLGQSYDSPSTYGAERLAHMVEITRGNPLVRRREQSEEPSPYHEQVMGQDKPKRRRNQSSGREAKLENMSSEASKLTPIQSRPNRDRMDPEIYEKQEKELKALQEQMEKERAASMSKAIQQNKLANGGDK